MGPESIVSVKSTIAIDTMSNFNGDFHGHGHDDVTCRRTFKEPGMSGAPGRVMHHVMKISYEAPGEILSLLNFFSQNNDENHNFNSYETTFQHKAIRQKFRRFFTLFKSLLSSKTFLQREHFTLKKMPSHSRKNR